MPPLSNCTQDILLDLVFKLTGHPRRQADAQYITLGASRAPGAGARIAPLTLSSGGRDFTRALNRAFKRASGPNQHVWTTIQVDTQI